MLGPNNFVCKCAPGWTGNYCTQYVSSCSLTFCSNGGTCFEISPGIPACYCPPCFTGNLCQALLNLCDPVNNPCLNNGNCVTNFPAKCSFNCSCSVGFMGTR